MWKCLVCGYVWDGEGAPEKCPKCRAPQSKFEKLDDAAMEKVERSRFTNGLHMNLILLLNEVMGLAEDGIDDNLDGGCVKIFKAALEQAEILQQSCKAELEGHVKKGKWG